MLGIGVDMSKTFSDGQIKITKDLMYIQKEICNRIDNKIQEDFLRKPMSNEELEEELNLLKKSLIYVIDENFKQMKRNL